MSSGSDLALVPAPELSRWLGGDWQKLHLRMNTSPDPKLAGWRLPVNHASQRKFLGIETQVVLLCCCYVYLVVEVDFPFFLFSKLHCTLLLQSPNTRYSLWKTLYLLSRHHSMELSDHSSNITPPEAFFELPEIEFLT